MVKNLDSGDLVPAEKLFEEYRAKGGLVNPLAYQIQKRGAQNEDPTTKFGEEKAGGR
jgi:hypothetical protein